MYICTSNEYVERTIPVVHCDARQNVDSYNTVKGHVHPEKGVPKFLRNTTEFFSGGPVLYIKLIEV